MPWVRLHFGLLCAMRRATLPGKNGLLHTNRQRDAVKAEGLCWVVFDHLQTLVPQFGRAWELVFEPAVGDSGRWWFVEG